jgi:hypothetical protein
MESVKVEPAPQVIDYASHSKPVGATVYGDPRDLVNAFSFAGRLGVSVLIGIFAVARVVLIFEGLDTSSTGAGICGLLCGILATLMFIAMCVGRAVRRME